MILLGSCEPKAEQKSQEHQSSKVSYDSVRAKELGADDYGMRPYVMAFLKRGSNSGLTQEESARLQAEHLKNITRLAEEGKLSLAGPFMDDGELRGIYVFNVSSMDEARRLTETDPAIRAGVLTMELRPWYGSAALQELNDRHRSLQKTSITGE